MKRKGLAKAFFLIEKTLCLLWLIQKYFSVVRVSMSIICEHVHELELRKGWCGNVASVPKTPFNSYSCISELGHAYLKINLVLISLLTGKYSLCATQEYKKN